MNEIIFQDVSFSYTSLPLFQNENFSIPKNSLIGIIGPNGGGKTTLLKLLLGFLKPASGQLNIFGNSPEKMQDKMGYVPQYQIFDKDFPISLLDLVLMGCLSKTKPFYRYSKKEKEIAKNMLELFHLEDYQNAAFGHLSGGIAQRALIARALISDPEILFLDEPTANVDSQSKQEIFQVIQTSRSNKTVFMVSHDLNSTLKMFDMVLCVDKGIKLMQPKEVCEHFKVGLYHEQL